MLDFGQLKPNAVGDVQRPKHRTPTLGRGPFVVSPPPHVTSWHAEIMTSRAINLTEKLSQFDEHWSPMTVTTFNGHDVMVVKVKGGFT